MNKVILMGRLVADPEFSMTSSRVARCTFRIAVDRPVRQGEEKQSDFFRITCWDKTAELVDRYFVKGKPILIEGRIQNDNYVDKNGVQQYQNQIIADRVSFLLSDPTRTAGSGNSRYDDYDDRDRRSSRSSRYDDDDRRSRYDDDDRRDRRSSRYDDDDRRRYDDDRRRPAPADAAPKKDVQLGNDNDSDLGDFQEIISENDLPF